MVEVFHCTRGLEGRPLQDRSSVLASRRIRSAHHNLPPPEPNQPTAFRSAAVNTIFTGSEALALARRRSQRRAEEERRLSAVSPGGRRQSGAGLAPEMVERTIGGKAAGD